MTAFITHFLRKQKHHKERLLSVIYRVLRCALSFCVMSCALVNFAHADTQVDLEEFKLERQDAAVVLTGQWHFELPQTLEDALLKGIALYFVSEVEITQERWYVYNQTISRAERHVRLFYQPLTRRWRVNISSQAFSSNGLGVSLGQSYETLEDAMSAVRRMAQWRIANVADVNPDAKQMLTIHFKLDLKQLPRPLQIGAAGHSDWNIVFNKTQRLELAP